jgi:hypothetical protein
MYKILINGIQTQQILFLFSQFTNRTYVAWILQWFLETIMFWKNVNI